MADILKHHICGQAPLVSRNFLRYKGQPVKLQLSTIVAMVICCITIGLSALVIVILTARHSNNFLPSLKSRHSKADDSHSDCDPFPQLHSVPLPERCQVTYSNGHITNSTSYTLGQCSNCLCVPPYWARSVDTRYCCRPANTTNITYSCPHYLHGQTISVSNVPISCTCQSCGNQAVTFILRLQNKELEPVILANVTVNEMTSYQTDDKGYVGFSVSALQSKVHLQINVFGYQEIEDEYFVLPGQTNSLTLTLTSLSHKTLIPPQSPFLLSLTDLSIHQLTMNFSFKMLTSEELESLLPGLSDVWNYGESFAYFPSEFFPPNQFFTFLSSPADQYFNNLKASFTAYKDRSSYRTSLYAVISGQLDIQDENGAPFITTTNEEDPSKHYGVLALLSDDLQSSSHKPHLFTYNIASKHFEQISKGTILVPMNRDSAHLHLFTPHTVTFPQTYLIAVQESASCFIAVTARDVNGLIQTKQDKKSTAVKATTKIWYSESEWMSSTTYGRIDGCLLVPCKGELTLRVLGLSEEEEHHYLQLNNIELELLEVEDESSRVFRSERECNSLGLPKHKTAVSLSRSIQVDLIPDYCIDPQPLSSYFDSKPLSSLSMDSTTISYCSVRLAISLPPFTSATITATTADSEMKTERIELNADVVEPELSETEIDYGSGNSGSGAVADEIPNRYVHYRCFTFPCTSEVTLATRMHLNTLNNAHHLANNLHYPSDYFKEVVYRVGWKKDYENDDTYSTCLPYSAPPLAILNSNGESTFHFLVNLAPPASGKFTYRASVDHFGVSVSTGVPQVAWEKCRRSESAGIQFQCLN